MSRPSTTTPPRKRGLTARQKVQAKYPFAFGWRPFSTADYEIRDGLGNVLASALSAVAAWAKAARNL